MGKVDLLRSSSGVNQRGAKGIIAWGGGSPQSLRNEAVRGAAYCERYAPEDPSQRQACRRTGIEKDRQKRRERETSLAGAVKPDGSQTRTRFSKKRADPVTSALNTSRKVEGRGKDKTVYVSFTLVLVRGPGTP